MSYVKPADLAQSMIEAGQSKVLMSTRDILIRGYMGGAILTLGAAFAVTVSTQTSEPLLGAILFPVGFILLYLMGFELLTGFFTLTPLALIDKRPGVNFAGVMRSWGLVFVGNFAGAFTVAIAMAIYFTYGFTSEPSAVGHALSEIGHGRTVGYAEHGAGGMLTLFTRGVLCNWMVSTGVIAAMMAKDVISKALVMWMPVMLFFYMGFEHSVVNMFLFPTGLLLGADFTIGDYLIWNEIPTVLGNIVGGITFVGLTIYATHARTAPKRVALIRPNGKRFAAHHARIPAGLLEEHTH